MALDGVNAHDLLEFFETALVHSHRNKPSRPPDQRENSNYDGTWLRK
jgi:hypothetical protein